MKSDDIDAVRAARQARAGVRLSEPRRRGDREAIRVLLTTRGQAITFRTRAISALHALVTSAPDGLRQRLRTLPLGQLLQTCVGLRDSSRRSVEESATVLAMRSTARRALACEREAAELEVQLDRLVRRLAPQLLGQLESARSWPVRSSPPGRITDESIPRLPSPKLRGAAPIEACSGTITRHRLNRSGDRQLNSALHTIVLSACVKTAPQRTTCSVASLRARPSATSSGA